MPGQIHMIFKHSAMNETAAPVPTGTGLAEYREKTEIGEAPLPARGGIAEIEILLPPHAPVECERTIGAAAQRILDHRGDWRYAGAAREQDGGPPCPLCAKEKGAERQLDMQSAAGGEPAQRAI